MSKLIYPKVDSWFDCLKKGDCIAYDEVANSVIVIITYPNASYCQSLHINDDNKFYFPDTDGKYHFHRMIEFLSALTKIKFKRVYNHRIYKHLYICEGDQR